MITVAVPGWLTFTDVGSILHPFMRLLIFTDTEQADVQMQECTSSLNNFLWRTEAQMVVGFQGQILAGYKNKQTNKPECTSEKSGSSVPR